LFVPSLSFFLSANPQKKEFFFIFFLYGFGCCLFDDSFVVFFGYLYLDYLVDVCRIAFLVFVDFFY